MIIHIIRHTTPKINAGVCYGNTDLPLEDSFEAESQQVLEKLLTRYQAVFTSPLKRCYQLSTKLNTDQHQVDKRLIEYNFGDWELTPWSELTSNEAQSWMQNFVEQPAPNGDSMLSMQARVNEFWDNLLTSDLESVALVTHAGVQRLIYASIMKSSIHHIFRLQLDYGSILEVKSDASSGFISIRHL